MPFSWHPFNHGRMIPWQTVGSKLKKWARLGWVQYPRSSHGRPELRWSSLVTQSATYGYLQPTVLRLLPRFVGVATRCWFVMRTYNAYHFAGITGHEFGVCVRIFASLGPWITGNYFLLSSRYVDGIKH